MAAPEEQAVIDAAAEKKPTIRYEMVDPPSRHGGKIIEKKKVEDPPPVNPPTDVDKDKDKNKNNPPPDTTKDFVPKTEHEKALSDLNLKLQAKDAELLKFNGTTPYTNPVYQRLETVEKADPEKAKLYQKVLFGNPSDMELWKIKFLKENPGIDDAAADKKMKRTFPELFKEDPDKDSQAYKDQIEDLQLESSRAKVLVRKEFDQIEVKAAQEALPQTDPEQEALVASWKPSFQTLRTESKFKLDVKVDDVTTVNLEVEIPADELNEAQLEGARFLVTEKLKPDAEGVQKVRDHIRDYYIGKQSVKFATNLVKKTIEDRDRQWEQSVANGKKPGAAVVPPKTEKHGTETAFAKLMAQ